MFNNQKHLFFLILADSGSRDPRVMQEKYELYLEVLEVHPPSLVHLCPPAGPLSKGKSGRKLGPTCFCSGDEGMDGNSASRKHSGSQICRIRLESVTGFLEPIDCDALKCTRILA